MLYPQNGDRIVAIDSVTSPHPMYCDSRLLSVLWVMTLLTLRGVRWGTADGGVACRVTLSQAERSQGGYIFYAGASLAGVSCRRRWPRLLLLS